METPASEPSLAMRLLIPFVQLLRDYPGFPVEVLPDLAQVDPDERVTHAAARELLDASIAITGDPDIGLKAARMIELGDYGALEYAATSAPTARAAIDVVARYVALVNDALTFSVDIGDETITMRLDSSVPLSRASEDFQVAAFQRGASFRRPAGVRPLYEVHFMHPQPDDISEYAISFPGAIVRFRQPHSAIVVSRSYFDSPFPTADAKLHDIVSKHADRLLAELPRAESFTARVRQLLMKELSGGNPGAPHVAQQLHISSRTLTRRLEEEGTSFKEQLDQLRKGLALEYVGGSDLALSEIAFLLGFSQVAAFHRAFKRWTQQTPLEHRKQELAARG